MDKLKQSFSLALVIWGATNLSQVSRAQYHVPMQPPVPRHDTMFPRHDGINSTPSSTTRTSPSSSSDGTFTSKCERLLRKWEARRDQYGFGTEEYKIGDVRVQLIKAQCQ